MSSVIERFDQLVDKLPTFTHIEVEDVRRFTNAGEWQLALDLLVATAIMRKRGLSQEVYAEICALALLVHLEQPERLSLLTVDNLDRASSKDGRRRRLQYPRQEIVLSDREGYRAILD